MAITFYSKSGCPHCDEERVRLVSGGLPFTEIDVIGHPEVVPELLKLTRGRRIVPVVVEGARISVASRGGSEF